MPNKYNAKELAYIENVTTRQVDKKTKTKYGILAPGWYWKHGDGYSDQSPKGPFYDQAAAHAAGCIAREKILFDLQNSV